MNKFRQISVTRKLYWDKPMESLDSFLSRITEIVNILSAKVNIEKVNVQYLNDKIAVVSYYYTDISGEVEEDES